MVDYMRAIKRPFSDITTLIIGIVLYVIPIANFIPLGYALKSAATASRNDFSTFEFSDYGGLFVKGLIAAIIGVIYLIPAVIVFVGAPILALLIRGSTGALLVGLGTLLGLLLALLAFFLLPLALTKYAIEGNFGAAFGCGGIFKKAFTVKYIVTWILMLIISWAIGFFTLGLLAFPAMVAFFTAIGEVYPEL